LNALRQNNPKSRFILLSSAAVYGNPQRLPITEEHPPNPISPYGFHKWMSELLCKEFYQVYRIPSASVRIFSAYGPGLRRQVIWDLCHKALTQPELRLQGTGQESRDFIHAAEVARAIYLLAGRALCQAEIYNLASGIETKIDTLAKMILNVLEVDIPISFDGIVPTGNPMNWRADLSCLSQLGFQPEIPLSKGLEITANWCRAEILSK
jgi:UDP-glucose 4-epimerase